ADCLGSTIGSRSLFTDIISLFARSARGRECSACHKTDRAPRGVWSATFCQALHVHGGHNPEHSSCWPEIELAAHRAVRCNQQNKKTCAQNQPAQKSRCGNNDPVLGLSCRRRIRLRCVHDLEAKILTLERRGSIEARLVQPLT